jgi:hypothetical protein
MRFRKRDRDSAATDLRPVLFGDLPLNEWPSAGGSAEHPWALFESARTSWGAGDRQAAVAAWEEIARDDHLESRHILQAWHFLRMAGVQPTTEKAVQVFGVVAEVAVDGGHDVLAACSDGTARYLNHGGAVVVADDAALGDLATAVRSWLAIGQRLATMIGVWDGQDLPQLPPGHTRVLMLTPGGFRFGQGPDDQLRADPAAAAFLSTATPLLLVLTGPVTN